MTSAASTTLRVFPLSSQEDSSAVSKVFAVTELLEAILEHLPFLHEEEDTSHLYMSYGETTTVYSQPQSLFGVQRVSQKFNKTVKSSKLLRQLMFLEPLTRSLQHTDMQSALRTTPIHYQQSPLEWFCTQTDLYTHRNASGSLSMSAEIMCYPRHRASQLWRRAEASWRQIRIARYKDSDSVSIDWIVNANAYTVEDTDIELKYVEKQVFGPDQTIGELYDSAWECYGRSFETHLESLAALVDE